MAKLNVRRAKRFGFCHRRLCRTEGDHEWSPKVRKLIKKITIKRSRSLVDEVPVF